MNAKSLAVSHVLAVSLGVVVGYGLNEAITTESPGVTPAPQSLKTEPKQARQEKTMRPEKPSVAPTELGQAREQIASLQAELDQTQQDLAVAEQTGLENPEDGRTRPQTLEEKLAAYRKLVQDPDVRHAMMEESRKVMEDPETQSARRAQQEVQANFLLDELASKLGLADDHRDELMKLWVDGQMAEMEVMMQAQMGSSDGLNEEEQAALQERIKAVQEQERQKMRNLLGADFEVYDTYTKTMMERATLNKLYSSGQPLDDYTKEALLVIMGEEQAAVGEPAPYYGIDMATVLAIQRDRLARMEIRDAKVIERATSYLTEDQHETLVQSLNAARAQSETNIKYVEAMVEQQEQEEQEGQGDSDEQD